LTTFLADENFPGPAIVHLRKHDIDIKSVVEQNSGISDELVMKWAMKEEYTILTHDSDYGELIFKFNFKPKGGVIYFRIQNFEPSDPAKILIALLDQNINFTNHLTVISDSSVRQRHY
jgi:predicted nuclease of predicted toxin-antitoxin system